MNNEIIRMRKEKNVAYFKVLTQHLTGKTERVKREVCPTKQISGPSFEPEP
jgi:hypothetical protein